MGPMITTTETGIFPIQTTPELPIEYAYTAARSGGEELRLPKHVQRGGSFVYSTRFAGGLIFSQDAQSLDRATSVLCDRDSFQGGLPSHEVPMEVPGRRELWEASAKLRDATSILGKIRGHSPYAEPLSELERLIEQELVDEELAAAREKAREIGRIIAEISNKGGNLWLVVNPPESDSRLRLLDEYDEGEEIKVAKLRGLALFEQNNKIHANPVVEGKYRSIGQIVSNHYKARNGYLYY